MLDLENNMVIPEHDKTDYSYQGRFREQLELVALDAIKDQADHVYDALSNDDEVRESFIELMECATFKKAKYSLLDQVVSMAEAGNRFNRAMFNYVKSCPDIIHTAEVLARD